MGVTNGLCKMVVVTDEDVENIELLVVVGGVDVLVGEAIVAVGVVLGTVGLDVDMSTATVVLLVVAAAVLLVVDVSAGTVVLVVPAVPGQGMPSASLQRMGNMPMSGGAPVPPSHVVAAASKIAPTKCSGAQSACLAQDRKARIA